jgi:hypothetical protein
MSDEFDEEFQFDFLANHHSHFVEALSDPHPAPGRLPKLVSISTNIILKVSDVAQILLSLFDLGAEVAIESGHFEQDFF